jgi:hypothetical protein
MSGQQCLEEVDGLKGRYHNDKMVAFLTRS